MWKNKVVIITGSSMGIGFALAKELALKGAKVVINGSNAVRLHEADKILKADGLQVASVPGDISNFEDCSQIIATTIKLYGKIDALINNAGISAESTVEELQPAVFQKVIAINFLGAFNMTNLALPYLKKQGGNILFIGSIAGLYGISKQSAYSSSKMALTALAESLKQELHKTNVYVSIAYLGFVENNISKKILNKNGESIPQPERNNVSKMSQEHAAGQLIEMMEKRTFKKVFSPLGKATALLSKIAPRLLHLALLRLNK